MAILMCALPSCSNDTPLPDADWLVLAPAQPLTVAPGRVFEHGRTFCCAQHAVLWLEQQTRPSSLLGAL